MPLLWRIALITCLLAIAVAGIDWGLPSSKAAPYLASVGQQWSGQRLAGFDADRAREAFDLSAELRPLMVIAVGRLGDYADVDPEIAERDSMPR